ncbi:MAG TPA: abortive infection family protein, partial [Nitrososphaera sp.]|nr:abortive infection family protein [Nitrososphaera sp.]
IKDAETLIERSGATSGVDRVHTALHGYLKAVCDGQGIAYGADAGITELFKLLKQNHPKLQNLGTRSAEITQVLRSLSAILDALNPVRNRASVAHPNIALLEEDEAMLVINVARTILHYLDAKFS